MRSERGMMGVKVSLRIGVVGRSQLTLSNARSIISYLLLVRRSRREDMHQHLSFPSSVL